MSPPRATTCLALLSTTEGSALLLRVDGTGRVISHQALRPGVRANVPDGERQILAIPGHCVRSTWMEITARSEAQATAAARHLVQGQTADPGNGIHVVLAPRRDDDPWRQILVMDPADLQHCLEVARALGMEPDAVLPDYMLVPDATTDGDPGTRVRVIEREGRWLVRGPRLAFSAEPALARVMLEACRHADPQHDADGHGLAAGLPGGDVNLLQHRFATVRGEQTSAPTWRRVAWLLALLLLSPLLVTATGAARHALATTSLESEANGIARDLLGEEPGEEPVLALRRALDAEEARGAGAMPMLAALFAETNQISGMYLERIDLEAGNTAIATIVHARPNDLDILKTRLAERAIRISVQEPRGTTAGSRSRIVLTAEGASE